MNKQINTLVQKEMTRKEFLATLGFGAVSIMGFGSIVKLLNGKSSVMRRTVTSGYGSNPYGGVKN